MAFSYPCLSPRYTPIRQFHKLELDSTSTRAELSPEEFPSINPEQFKEKSQLCRQYMEYGFCPYTSRCKFAHGSHELQYNKSANMKYKTRECDNFGKKWCCMYGSRCNFIHKLADKQQPFKTSHDITWKLIRRENIVASRLLEILTCNKL